MAAGGKGKYFTRKVIIMCFFSGKILTYVTGQQYKSSRWTWRDRLLIDLFAAASDISGNGSSFL